MARLDLYLDHHHIIEHFSYVWDPFVHTWDPRLWSSSEAERILHRKKLQNLFFSSFLLALISFGRASLSVKRDWAPSRVNKQIYTFFLKYRDDHRKKSLINSPELKRIGNCLKISFLLNFFVEFFPVWQSQPNKCCLERKNLCLNDFNAKWKLSDEEGNFPIFPSS